MYKKALFTTPIFYPTGKPHIGHIFSTCIADILVRYHELLGWEVHFLTGLDEHGQKILKTAKNQGTTISELIARSEDQFLTLWNALNIEFTHFYKTSSEVHKKTVLSLIESLQDSGSLYKGLWESEYCIECETTGPCQLHKTIIKNEPSYFLKTSQYSEWLTHLFQKTAPPFLEKQSSELQNNFLSDLKDLSISRLGDVPGIKFPKDEDYTVYVWLDALMSYFKLKKECQKGKIVHVIGKDITRFHAIYLPIIEKMMGIDNHGQLLIHGLFNSDGVKISKSLKNYDDPHSLINTVGSDGVRMYLSSLSLNKDHDYSFEEVVQSHNTFLSNKLGNLITRVGGVAKKFNIFKTTELLHAQEFDDISQQYQQIFKDLEKNIYDNDIKEIVERTEELLDSLNLKIQTLAPWSLTADNPLLLECINQAYKVLSGVCWVLSPILVDFYKQISKTLGHPPAATPAYFMKDSNFKDRCLKGCGKIYFQRIYGEEKNTSDPGKKRPI